MSGRWSQAEAGTRALTLLRAETPWRTIVMLGRKVAKAFEPITGFMSPFSGGRVHYNDVVFGVVSIPHPSGRSREWNDPSSYDRARAAILAIEPRMPLNIPVEDL
jgi:uracil-DNA glycosylase